MWSYFKEDLKDVISYNHRFKNSDYDANGITESVARRLMFQMDTYEKHIGKKAEITDYRLKGWDWGELCDKFGLEDYEVPKGNRDNYMHLKVEGTLEYNKVLHYLEDRWMEDNQVVEVLRDYLRSMIPDKGPYTHYDAVWNAMLDIKDDMVFMQFVFALLGHMWT